MRPRDPGGCEPSNALLTRNLEPEAKEGWGGGAGAGLRQRPGSLRQGAPSLCSPWAGGEPAGGCGAWGLWGLQGLFLGSLHPHPPSQPELAC